MSESYPTATIEALFNTDDPDDHYSSPRARLDFDLDGIVGDKRHRGRTRLADMRLKFYEKKKYPVLNRQSVSLIDDLSLDHIGDEMGLDPDVIMDQYGENRQIFIARCIGANMILGDFQGTDAIPRFHDLPNATDFGPFNPDTGKSSDASLMITRYNSPCIHPGKTIEEKYPAEVDRLAQRFIIAAEARRGFVAMVVKTGSMAVGQTVTFRPLPTAK